MKFSNASVPILFLMAITLLGCQSNMDAKTHTPSLSAAQETWEFHLPTTDPRFSVDEPDLKPTETELPAPMRFSLPTPGAQPVTAWRPPLYPVPWAVSPFDHFYFNRPISADQTNWPNPDYRYGGEFFKPGEIHTGVDIPAAQGTPVLASGAGQVIWADWGLYTHDPTNLEDPYGLAVVIRHEFGFNNQYLFSVYAHLDEILVTEGQWIESGFQIGNVGQTGFTTGPHLHFEVRLGEDTYFNTTNPELWLVPPLGWGVLAGRIADSYDNPLAELEVLLVSKETEEEWELITYPPVAVKGDPYYQENLALSDLKSGEYTLSFQYFSKKQEITIQVRPGEITYFYFRGLYGFSDSPPPTEGTEYLLTAMP